MSVQPLTYESVLELIREHSREMREEHREFRRSLKKQGAEFDRRMQETDRRQKETDRIARKAQKIVGELGCRIGEIVEKMVEGNIVEKFRVLDYDIMQCAQNVHYEYKKLGIRGEIDLFLEDGDVAILIEVKTTLTTSRIRKHIKKIEEYRRCADARGDKRRFIGAVAGAVVKHEAMEFAHKNGMYVIVQSGNAVEIVQTPEGFKAKEW